MAGITVEVDGLSALLRQLEQVGRGGEQVVLETIVDLVTDTHAFAVSGIERGPKSGATYRRGNVVHQASAPGQYPASDTGRLASGVRMELPSAGNMTGRVGTAVAYGPMLEFGTSRMAARPWLMSSFERAKAGVAAELRRKLEAKV
jgi:phage gpG-like protein